MASQQTADRQTPVSGLNVFTERRDRGVHDRDVGNRDKVLSGKEMVKKVHMESISCVSCWSTSIAINDSL